MMTTPEACELADAIEAVRLAARISVYEAYGPPAPGSIGEAFQVILTALDPYAEQYTPEQISEAIQGVMEQHVLAGIQF